MPQPRTVNRMSSESEADGLDAHNQADTLSVCQTRNRGAGAAIGL